MKYLKMLGLAAVAAAAMTAFAGAGTASANTVLCETTITVGCGAQNWDWNVGSEIDFSLANGNTSRLTDTAGFITIDTCTAGTIKGILATTTTPTFTVPAGSVTWSGCTTTTHTLTPGSIQFHAIAGTHNATVTATGLGVTTQFGGNTCTYGFGSIYKDIGTLTGDPTGTNLTLHINVAVVLDPQHSAASGCPASGRWTATYQYTGFTHLHIAEN